MPFTLVRGLVFPLKSSEIRSNPLSPAYVTTNPSRVFSLFTATSLAHTLAPEDAKKTVFRTSKG